MNENTAPEGQELKADKGKARLSLVPMQTPLCPHPQLPKERNPRTKQNQAAASMFTNAPEDWSLYQKIRRLLYGIHRCRMRRRKDTDLSRFRAATAEGRARMS